MRGLQLGSHFTNLVVNYDLHKSSFGERVGVKAWLQWIYERLEEIE